MKILLNLIRTSPGSGPYGAWEDGRYFCASLQCHEMVQRSGLAEVAFQFLVQRAISGETTLSGDTN